MLNIPETVKALYKRDGVNKNFRAHFPNGELPDITNENIVQESVKFQESVCSQDVFKFGLTEASVIEFETVGVPNMYGMTVACYNEIDCSSLTAAEIADIEAGTWDGTFDSTNKVFAVPYGVYRIDSCPRDHQAMAHRKVTAYTLPVVEKNSFEEKKDALFLYASTYTPSLRAFAMSQIARRSPQTLIDNGYTRETMTAEWESSAGPPMIKLEDSNGGWWYYEFVGYFSLYRDDHPGGTVRKDRLYSIDYNGETYDPSSALSVVVGLLQERGIDPARSGYSSLEEIAKAAFPPSFKPSVVYRVYSTTSWDWDGYIPTEDGEVFYPFRNESGYNYQSPSGTTFYAWKSAYVVCRRENGEYYDDQRYLWEGEKTPPTVSKYIPPSVAADLTLTFEATADKRVKPSGVSTKVTAYSFVDAIDKGSIVNGFLELNAYFAAVNRSGGNKLVRLTDASPVEIIPGEYSQMWFDEYDVEPVGTVRYAYTDDANEEQIVNYQIGDGASVYDMSDNAVLKIVGATPDTVEAMLDADFVPYLSPINFVPIDLSMKGLPYIEAGDALTVTTQDGTVCSSYALRRELDGVQVLTDQIDSESGLIIDSEEGD